MTEKERPASRVKVDLRALNLIWPKGSLKVYHSREPLWGQPWSWSKEWLETASRYNTLPAMLVRGAAMVAGQALLLLSVAVYGVALGLWLLGVTA